MPAVSAAKLRKLQSENEALQEKIKGLSEVEANVKQLKLTIDQLKSDKKQVSYSMNQVVVWDWNKYLLVLGKIWCIFRLEKKFEAIILSCRYSVNTCW